MLTENVQNFFVNAIFITCGVMALLWKGFFIKFSLSDKKFTPAIESTVKLGNKELFGHLKIVP